jgi:hypothetical protein
MSTHHSGPHYSYQRPSNELATIRGLLVVLIFISFLGMMAVGYMAFQLYSFLDALSHLF